MPTFGFSAFLKLLSLNPRPQRRQVVQRLSPSEGGYDFHRSLRIRTARLMLDGADLQALIDEAAILGNPAERQSLESGLRQLQTWREATPGTVLSLPGSTYESKSGEFRVNFTPDFGYRLSGQDVAIHLWNTSVDLSERMTYAALGMSWSAYPAGTRPDDVAVLSLPDRRLYRLSDVSDQTRLSAIVSANLDHLFETVREELGGGVPPAPRPDRPVRLV